MHINIYYSQPTGIFLARCITNFLKQTDLFHYDWLINCMQVTSTQCLHYICIMLTYQNYFHLIIYKIVIQVNINKNVLFVSHEVSMFDIISINSF